MTLTCAFLLTLGCVHTTEPSMQDMQIQQRRAKEIRDTYPLPADLPWKKSSQKGITMIKNGEIDRASAAWWGFDPADSTEILQTALDSGAAELWIPKMNSSWVSGPLEIPSDITLLFEEGVELIAQKNVFKGIEDAFFAIFERKNVVFLGYGASISMHKQDYQKQPYVESQWRHLMSIRSSQDIRIEGLTLNGSGGDGIYLGRTNSGIPWNEDITLRNLEIINHHRQGISVISARNLLAENLRISDTSGHSPEAGIDLEPNRQGEVLDNLIFRNIISENNRGAAFQVSLQNLNDKSEPLSVKVIDSVLADGFLAVFVLNTRCAPHGSIQFINTETKGLRCIFAGPNLQVSFQKTR